MRQIVKATHHLRWDGISFESSPLLLRDRVVEPLPSMWLMMLRAEARPNTVMAYARAIMVWFNWLELRKMHTFRVTIDDVRRFKLILEQNRSNSTVNIAVVSICTFYEWAYLNGYSSILPFRLSGSSKRDRADVGPSDVGKVKLNRVRRTTPDAHTVREFDTILAHTPRRHPGLVLRDELVAELSFYSSFRSMEGEGLRCADIEGAKRTKSFFTFKITVTKGGTARTVAVSELQHQRLLRYIRVYRAAIVARMTSRNPRYIDPGSLFLTIQGKPLRREYISSSWAEAARLAKVKSRYHNNRHSFATRVIAAADAQGLPAKRIASDLLGHRSDKTIEVYDHNPVLSEDVAGSEWFKKIWGSDE